jgi:glutamate synthase domain-containing protein 1/glutamate synthase domain-containing protein 3
MTNRIAETYLRARRELIEKLPVRERFDEAAEGGCGVVGLAANIGIPGRHVLTASEQMHNRGNGKGGGVAMAGLDPHQMKVDAETLRTHYLLQIALLDSSAREEIEQNFITPNFDVAQSYLIDHVENFEAVDGLEVRPPDVWRYFVRVKPDVLDQFAEEKDLHGSLTPRAIEDEFVYQNSFKLNTQFYASLGEKRAFVLSHGRDLLVLKIVGYAEQVVEYYKLEDQTAQIWIAHQRYPTKGRVWHPGGAHPFIGMNEALVHNGDFANYHAVGAYLRQRNMAPLFLTDTEVAAQLFDLWDRVYRYPLEVTLEAMAPTTEHDFAMLPQDKQQLYKAVQATHMHGSPDGPWFFILARSQADVGRKELLGITDTSMLRPQVFALYENLNPEKDQPVQIGLIASERQAINACLRSLSAEDSRFQPYADKYWVARGGSHTDGGAFSFAVTEKDGLVCTNKFGATITLDSTKEQLKSDEIDPEATPDNFRREWQNSAHFAFDDGGVPTFWEWLKPWIHRMDWNELAWGMNWLVDFGGYGDDEWRFSLDILEFLRDRHYDTGDKKRASVQAIVNAALARLLDEVPLLDQSAACDSGLIRMRRLNWSTREMVRGPLEYEETLVFDVQGFPPEGDDAAARMIAKTYQAGWQHIIAYNWHGGRFAGSGLGADSDGLRLDLYGDVGDYAASGLDGSEVHIHGDAQDQVGQILRRGKLVVHGDAGQTFLYGAKGGEIYVKGSAAGRPLINATGNPRAVINGTCLDYLAESFMAGNPLAGGGFVILNGVTFDDDGHLMELDEPYPGGNLFSLASGGAIYVRDPHHVLSDEQLNGGVYEPLSDADWSLIESYLNENERLFGIRVRDLLTVDGVERMPSEVYRKVKVKATEILTETENR